MDPRLLNSYSRELQHLREMAGEFAEEYPKIAGRLGLERVSCTDPYVERLLEGFAFLAARVQLKIDTEFPRFTRRLLEIVYPHYLAPVPSMAVVQFHPDLTEGSLAGGIPIPRDSVLRGKMGKGDQTACEYRTAQDTMLWPLELAEAEYFTHSRLLSDVDVGRGKGFKAGIRLRFRATAGLSFQKLDLDSVSLYLRGADEQPMHLYEQLVANVVSVIVLPVQRRIKWTEQLPPSAIRRVGFEENEASIPMDNRAFRGYRLLQEYFAFPQRFLFVELTGLRPAMRRCKESEIDVIVLLNRLDSTLQNTVAPENFALFCAPVVNLFPKRTDRIHLSTAESEYHVVPDRTRPTDYEIHSIQEVVGHGTSSEQRQEFRPFYGTDDLTAGRETMAFYTVDRVPRVLSAKQRRKGTRASYVGSEVFLSLVDGREAPYSSDLSQISISALCTNRDLPLHMAVGAGPTDFTMESGAPVEAVRCVSGPSAPRPSHAEGEVAWRLVGHLSLNYMSIVDSARGDGAAGLRELLTLYGDNADAAVRRQIEGVRSVVSRPVTRRLPIPGPVAFGRGLEVTLTLDEEAFAGMGVFLLGAVLEQFIGRYVAINSFTETVIRTSERGEIIRWPIRNGQRHTL